MKVYRVYNFQRVSFFFSFTRFFKGYILGTVVLRGA